MALRLIELVLQEKDSEELRALVEEHTLLEHRQRRHHHLSHGDRPAARAEHGAVACYDSGRSATVIARTADLPDRDRGDDDSVGDHRRSAARATGFARHGRVGRHRRGIGIFIM
jgi:hypothetical protein